MRVRTSLRLCRDASRLGRERSGTLGECHLAPRCSGDALQVGRRCERHQDRGRDVVPLPSALSNPNGAVRCPVGRQDLCSPRKSTDPGCERSSCTPHAGSSRTSSSSPSSPGRSSPGVSTGQHDATADSGASRYALQTSCSWIEPKGPYHLDSESTGAAAAVAPFGGSHAATQSAAE